MECLTQFLKEDSQYQFDIAHIKDVSNITDFFLVMLLWVLAMEQQKVMAYIGMLKCFLVNDSSICIVDRLNICQMKFAHHIGRH